MSEEYELRGSFKTANRIGCERIKVIDLAVDDEDTTMLAGIDPRNHCIYLVDGEQVFEIHYTQLKDTIKALQYFIPETE